MTAVDQDKARRLRDLYTKIGNDLKGCLRSR